MRCANLYGPNFAHKNSVVAKFFKDSLTTGRITIDGDRPQRRDFIYLGDSCRAVLLALKNGVSGEGCQIATGVETSIAELAALVHEIAGRNAGIVYGLPRQRNIRRNYSAVAKGMKNAGVGASNQLRQGLTYVDAA